MPLPLQINQPSLKRVGFQNQKDYGSMRNNEQLFENFVNTFTQSNQIKNSLSTKEVQSSRYNGNQVNYGNTSDKLLRFNNIIQSKTQSNPVNTVQNSTNSQQFKHFQQNSHLNSHANSLHRNQKSNSNHTSNNQSNNINHSNTINNLPKRAKSMQERRKSYFDNKESHENFSNIGTIPGGDKLMFQVANIIPKVENSLLTNLKVNHNQIYNPDYNDNEDSDLDSFSESSFDINFNKAKYSKMNSDDKSLNTNDNITKSTKKDDNINQDDTSLFIYDYLNEAKNAKLETIQNKGSPQIPKITFTSYSNNDQSTLNQNSNIKSARKQEVEILKSMKDSYKKMKENLPGASQEEVDAYHKSLKDSLQRTMQIVKSTHPLQLSVEENQVEQSSLISQLKDSSSVYNSKIKAMQEFIHRIFAKLQVLKNFVKDERLQFAEKNNPGSVQELLVRQELNQLDDWLTNKFKMLQTEKVLLEEKVNLYSEQMNDKDGILIRTLKREEMQGRKLRARIEEMERIETDKNNTIEKLLIKILNNEIAPNQAIEFWNNASIEFNKDFETRLQNRWNKMYDKQFENRIQESISVMQTDALVRDEKLQNYISKLATKYDLPENVEVYKEIQITKLWMQDQLGELSLAHDADITQWILESESLKPELSKMRDMLDAAGRLDEIETLYNSNSISDVLSQKDSENSSELTTRKDLDQMFTRQLKRNINQLAEIFDKVAPHLESEVKNPFLKSIYDQFQRVFRKDRKLYRRIPLKKMKSKASVNQSSSSLLHDSSFIMKSNRSIDSSRSYIQQEDIGVQTNNITDTSLQKDLDILKNNNLNPKESIQYNINIDQHQNLSHDLELNNNLLNLNTLIEKETQTSNNRLKTWLKEYLLENPLNDLNSIAIGTSKPHTPRSDLDYLEEIHNVKSQYNDLLKTHNDMKNDFIQAKNSIKKLNSDLIIINENCKELENKCKTYSTTLKNYERNETQLKDKLKVIEAQLLDKDEILNALQENSKQIETENIELKLKNEKIQEELEEFNKIKKSSDTNKYWNALLHSKPFAKLRKDFSQSKLESIKSRKNLFENGEISPSTSIKNEFGETYSLSNSNEQAINSSNFEVKDEDVESDHFSIVSSTSIESEGSYGAISRVPPFNESILKRNDSLRFLQNQDRNNSSSDLSKIDSSRTFPEILRTARSKSPPLNRNVLKTIYYKFEGPDNIDWLNPTQQKSKLSLLPLLDSMPPDRSILSSVNTIQSTISTSNFSPQTIYMNRELNGNNLGSLKSKLPKKLAQHIQESRIDPLNNKINLIKNITKDNGIQNDKLKEIISELKSKEEPKNKLNNIENNINIQTVDPMNNIENSIQIESFHDNNIPNYTNFDENINKTKSTEYQDNTDNFGASIDRMVNKDGFISGRSQTDDNQNAITRKIKSSINPTKTNEDINSSNRPTGSKFKSLIDRDFIAYTQDNT